jgi:hypothetical protein
VDQVPARASFLLLPLLLLSISRSGFCYEDGAPPGHTGGFREPDCSLCHSDSAPNSPGGSLKVEGLPDRISAGACYDLEIVLSHAELRTGGFQLAFRSPDGKPAGAVVSLSARTNVVAEGEREYLQHSKEGIQPDRNGLIRWHFRWVAAGVTGPVQLNVAANAANDDISALGDYIFTLERILEPDEQ